MHYYIDTYLCIYVYIYIYIYIYIYVCMYVCVCVCVCVCVYVFTHCRAGCNTRSIFNQSEAGLYRNCSIFLSECFQPSLVIFKVKIEKLLLLNLENFSLFFQWYFFILKFEIHIFPC